MTTFSRRTFSLSAVGLLSGGLLAACGSESGDEVPTVTRVVAPNAPPTNTVASGGAAASPVASPAGSPVASPAVAPEGSAVSGTDGGALPEGGGSAEGADASGTTGGATQATINFVGLLFEPAEVTVAAGVPVTLNFVNASPLPHGYNIDELGIASELLNGQGEANSVTVTIPAGTYDSYCPVPGHKEGGMVGKLIAQ